MNLPSNLFSDTILYTATLLFALSLAWALFKAPWHMLKQLENTNSLLGFSVLLMLLWSMKAGVHPGMTFHLIGATLFTLMFGWQFAIISMSLVLLATTAYSGIDWWSIPLNGMVMVVLPVQITRATLNIAVKYLPHHFFVYSMFNGFLSGAFTMAAVVMTSIVLLLFFGGYTWPFITHKFLPFLPLMMFAEAFFSGMLITGMILFRPEWVMTFDDKRYLHGK
jgi:uncharacterized membrane protein